MSYATDYIKSLEASSVIQREFTVTVYFPADQLLLFVFVPLYSVHVLGEGLLDGDNTKSVAPEPS